MASSQFQAEVQVENESWQLQGMHQVAVAFLAPLVVTPSFPSVVLVENVTGLVGKICLCLDMVLSFRCVIRHLGSYAEGGESFLETEGAC